MLQDCDILPISPTSADLAARRTRVVSWTSLDALFIVDDARRYLHVNAPAERLLATTRERILGRQIDDFTPPGGLATLPRAWRRLKRAGWLEGEGDMLRADGTVARIRFRVGCDVSPGRHLIIARHVGAPPPPGGGNVLTPRELEVLHAAAAGGSIQELAARLIVSPATVKTHLEHVYAKLGVRGRAAAVAAALRRGLID